MRLFHLSTFALALEPDVEQCTATTATTGPHEFEYNLRNIYQTAQLVETETKLKVIHGKVPEWLETHWFRTGPGKFEFGNDAYANLGDPMAMFQRTSFKNGEATFQSTYQGSLHHQWNEEANGIVTPEMGTWGQPEWVNETNMADWLQTPEFVSDNAYVSFFAVRGRLFASGETYHIWEVDPITLKGKRGINMGELLSRTLFKNSDTTKCATVATHLAHSRYDPDTDELIMSITCLTGDKMPKIRYVMYKIPNAGSTRLDTTNEQDTIDDIWGDGEIIFEVDGEHNNPMKLDYKQDYFHDFAITENYIVFALLSMKIDFLKMPQLMMDQQPLAFGAAYEDDAEGVFYVVNRHTGELTKRFKAPPNMSFHVLNAFEQDTDTIIYDVTSAPHGKQFGTVWFANLTGDYDDLMNVYNHVAPVQYPTRYELRLSDENDSMLTPQLMHKDGQLPHGGADFPMVNRDTVNKHKYNYAWVAGFRQVFNVDSLYKLNIETGETICRCKNGYVIGEGIFVPRPSPTDGGDEDNGVVINQWLSLTTDKRPRVTILDASDLSLIAELEYPVDYLPVGIHGMTYSMDTPTRSSAPKLTTTRLLSNIVVLLYLVLY